MEPIKGFEEVSAEEREFKHITPGAYLCAIVNAEYTPLNAEGKGNYLTLELEFSDGDLLNYCRDTYERAGFWPLTVSVSAKESVAWKFKQFTNAVESANEGYKWNWDESTLPGKDVHILINMEEYEKNNGDIGERVDRWNCEFLTVEQFEKGTKKGKLKKLQNKPVEAKDSFEAAISENPFA